MKIDADELALQDTSLLMTGIVVPSPIASVSTMDENGDCRTEATFQMKPPIILSCS